MLNKLTNKEYLDIVQWDVSNWKQTLFFWEKNFEIKQGMKVLALGEREGGMSLYFAKKGCEVVCTDLKEFPETTKDLHKSYEVDHLINYRNIDMCNIDFKDEQFDIVVFKSVIGAIGESKKQDQAISEVRRVLKKGGVLLFAENASGSKLHQMLRKKYTSWNKYWLYPGSMDFNRWGTSYSAYTLKNHGFIATFGRSERQRNLLAKIDTLLCPILPKSWKYITFGIMIK